MCALKFIVFWVLVIAFVVFLLIVRVYIFPSPEPYDPNAQCEMTIRYMYATSLDEAKRNPELWINRYDSPAEYADASVRMLFLTGVC